MLAAVERDVLLAAARDAIEATVLGRPAKLDPREQNGELSKRRAAFVTLRRRGTGDLRGCIGTLETDDPVSGCVRRLAVASALRDPRFAPVTADELPALAIHISVLSPRTAVRPEHVEVGRHGVVVELGERTGVFLPEVAKNHGWARERLLSETARKAGLDADAWRAEDAHIYVFEAEELDERESA